MNIQSYITIRNYIGKGMGETQYVKYLTYLIGLERAMNQAFADIILIGIAYLLCCLLIGYMWDKMRWYHEEAEWANRRNPFVHDVRRRLNCSTGKR